MKTLVCGLAMLLASVVASAQEITGTVESVEPRFAVTKHGDQKIVTKAWIRSDNDHALVPIEVDGGTVGDLTLHVSDVPLLHKGQHGRFSKKGIVIDRQGFDFVTYGSWPNAQATFYINPTNLDVSSDAAEAAILVGMNEWSTNSGSKFRFNYAGRTTQTTTGYDGRNVVVFRNESNNGALATAWSWWSGSTIVDSDITFWDGAYSFVTSPNPCNGQAFIEDVATHELGHSLGLNHSDVAGATMYPYYNWCDTSMRTIEADDRAGAISLYGTGTSEPPPPPSGIFLTTKASKGKGNRQVTLTWGGLSDTNVRIIRNGATIVNSTPNDGSHVDSLGKGGGGTFTYQVCDTAACTPLSTITF